MFESFLANTSTEGLAPLGTAPQRSFELITGTLRDLLGEPHAALFGEPVATQYGDRFDWYVGVEGSPRALGDLSEENQQAAKAKLAELVGDIQGAATKLLDSKSPDDQRLGEALSNALRYPDQKSVFVLGEGETLQPVLINWAWVRENQKAVSGSLSDTRSVPVAPVAPLARAARTSQGAGAAQEDAGARAIVQERGDSNLWWLIWLGWLLLMLIIGAILYLMIEACALNLPGVKGNCPGPGASVSDVERRTLVLRDQIAAIERQIGVADRACQPERAAAVVPDNDQSRLAERGGREGELTISLLWESRADLHMFVGCPSGELIHFGKQVACGGRLDVGGNHDPASSVSNPVESMYFDAPQSGKYAISVSVFDTHGQSETQPFRLRVKSGDSVEVFEGVATHGQEKWSMNYTFGVN